MAITFKTNSANQSKTSGTSLSLGSPGLAVPVDDYVIVAFAHDDAAGTYSVSDPLGNTYTEHPSSPVTFAGNVGVNLFYAKVTTQIGASDQITVTHPTLTARAGIFGTFGGVATASPTDGYNEATGTSAVPSSGSITPSENGTLVFGVVGIEGPGEDAFTQAAGFIDVWAGGGVGTTAGGAASNIKIGVGYQIQTTLAADAYDPGITSRDWAALIANFKAAAAAADRVPYFSPYPQLLAH